MYENILVRSAVNTILGVLRCKLEILWELALQSRESILKDLERGVRVPGWDLPFLSSSC
jgi:hypothetical protein